MERRRVRDQLVTALVEHALAEAVTTYTGVAEIAWFEQIARFGWKCRSLGTPVRHEGATLCGLAIAIAEDTPRCLAGSAIWSPIDAPGAARRSAGARA
jgi:N-acyl-L-homoserine lactone synthetase